MKEVVVVIQLLGYIIINTMLFRLVIIVYILIIYLKMKIMLNFLWERMLINIYVVYIKKIIYV